MGRSRVEIKKIEDKSKRQTTFTKRRQGLFKKAGDLCAKSGAEVAIITFSTAGNVFAYGNPSVENVVQRYCLMNGGDTAWPAVHDDGDGDAGMTEEARSSRVGEGLGAELEEEKKRERILERAYKRNGERPLLEVPVEELEWDELNAVENLIRGFKATATIRKMMLTLLPPNNFGRLIEEEEPSDHRPSGDHPLFQLGPH